MGKKGNVSRAIKYKNDRKKRICLRCGKKFDSYGVQNRICIHCNFINKGYNMQEEGMYRICIGKY
jgi:ribosomal protein L37E